MSRGCPSDTGCAPTPQHDSGLPTKPACAHWGVLVALIRSFIREQTPGQLNPSETVCDYAINDNKEHGRLLVPRSCSRRRGPGSSPTQVDDLDLDAARRLRAILKEEFDI